MRDIITAVLQEMCSEANPKVQNLFDKATGTKLTVRGAKVVNTFVAIAEKEYGDSVLFDGHRVDAFSGPRIGLTEVVNHNHRVGYNQSKVEEGTYLLSTTATFTYYDTKSIVAKAKVNETGKNLASEDVKTTSVDDAVKQSEEKETANQADYYYDGETVGKGLTGSIFADELKAELILDVKEDDLVDMTKVVRSYKGKEHDMLLSPTVFKNTLDTFLKKIGRAETCNVQMDKKVKTLNDQSYFLSPNSNEIFYIHSDNPSKQARVLAQVLGIRARFTPVLIGTQGHLMSKSDVMHYLTHGSGSKDQD